MTFDLKWNLPCCQRSEIDNTNDGKWNLVYYERNEMEITEHRRSENLLLYQKESESANMQRQSIVIIKTQNARTVSNTFAALRYWWNDKNKSNKIHVLGQSQEDVYRFFLPMSRLPGACPKIPFLSLSLSLQQVSLSFSISEIQRRAVCFFWIRYVIQSV